MAFPSTDVMRLKHIFFRLMVTDVGRFTYIAATALANNFNQSRRMRVSLVKSRPCRSCNALQMYAV